MFWKKKSNNNNQLAGFLGKDANIKGSLSYTGTVRLDGKMEGQIHTVGTLIVGENAVITADIYADTLIVCGQITGTVFAKQKVHLLATARLCGTVHAHTLIIDEGANFSGQSDNLVSDSAALSPQEAPSDNKKR